jgi:DNA-directed RNA polymerase specialized sigma24 family protein
MTLTQIANETGTSVSNVKVSLMRTREKLRTHLEKAGISL